MEEEEEELEKEEERVKAIQERIKALKEIKKQGKEKCHKLQADLNSIGLRLEAYTVRRVSILVFPVILACFMLMLRMNTKGHFIGMIANAIGLALAWRSLYVVGNYPNLIISATIAGVTIFFS